MSHSLRHTTALLTLLSSGYALAQTPAADSGAADPAQSFDTVIITGTRQAGLKAADSPAPIQILDAATLKRGGSPDLIQALTQNVPAFTSDAKGGDAAALTTAARLRGLNPNHTLILINGKRRHGTSNVNVTGGAFSGGASADLSLIPLSAIDHIEVLQDGAAAQYGSDAIAGVINIILKRNDQGGTVSFGGGQYYDGDGTSGNLSANVGLKPHEDAFLNLSVETKYHGHSDRSDLDARFVPPYLSAANANVRNAPGYPYVNRTFGDAAVRQTILSANGGIDLSGGTELYGFATYGAKHAEAIQNYRGTSTAPGVYPLGFSPVEVHDEEDFAFTVGVKGEAPAGWRYDLATTYGRDYASVGNIDSLNVQLWKDTGSTQSRFYEGYLKANQTTTNLDFSRDFNVGWASPLNVAFGAEHRVDEYAIGAGEAASIYRGGAAAFPGYTASDAGNHKRRSNALYVDVAGSPIDKLKLDAALRTERYSDFGSATVGKLTGRYDVAPSFAVRGTVSNGFRAPTLAEQSYSATSVSPTTASVILPTSAAAARLLGIDELKAEKSRNFSIGIVAKPAAKVTATLDVYQINIKDRILQSGTLYGILNGAVRADAVNAAIVANGNSIPAGLSSTGVVVFSNAGDTRNTGADAVITYADDYGGFGRVDWSLGANVNQVKVTKVKGAPSQVNGQQLLDKTAISYIEDSSPAFRINLGALWRKNDWTVNLRENVFGPSSYYTSVNNVTYYENRTGTKFITDLDVTRQITKAWAVTVGANNLFNVYPDKLNSDYRQALNAAGRQNVAQYASFSPIGINGGYYYFKANYRF
jgi:iron complex outermembrane receptor protein